MVIKSKLKYLRLFDADIKFCGLTEATRKQYLGISARYLDYTNNSPEWSRLELMEFIASLGGVTSTYSSWVLSIIKRFHRSIIDTLPSDEKKWPLGPREGPRTEVRKQPQLNPENMQKLLRIVKDGRDYAILRLFYATGMRRDELCGLNLKDFSGKNLTIPMSKGEEFRTVKLDTETIKTVNNYLELRGSNKSEALFVNTLNRRFSPSGLSQVFKKYFHKLGVEPRTGLHAIRRGLVTLLHDNGLTIAEIKEYMGWKTTSMVFRYIQLSPSKVGEKVADVHPFYKHKR